MAIKLLIGGSPCTNWSIAKTVGRETEPKGVGWELFKNYIIAKEKFKPDYFLYENNKSAAQPIKEQIAKELGFGADTATRFTYINSALVSAQNRQRFYVTNFGDIEQPEDRGILLKDIIETGEALNDSDGKSKTIRATCYKDGIRNLVANNVDKRTCVAEPVCLRYERTDEAKKLRKQSTVNKDNMIIKEANYEIIDGAKVIITDTRIRQGDEYGTKQGKYVYLGGGKSNTVSAGQAHNEKVIVPVPPGEWKTIYEVRDGIITIKDKQYAIKLADGYYIIRKLTVTEACRLQTMPDDYCKAVSATRGYQGLGNGWTAEVIIHLLQHANIPLDEEIIVLSMYDGIGTGRYCLEKMGYKNVTYYAYEIDKYPMAVANDNFPDIIQCGDAFAVRDEDWQVPMIGIQKELLKTGS